MPPPPAPSQLRTILRWYFRRIYGRLEGPGFLPWYCDPRRVGHFAIEPAELRSLPEPQVLFKLFISITMLQGYRDTMVFDNQRRLGPGQVRVLSNIRSLRGRVERHRCRALKAGAAGFPHECTVYKLTGRIDCFRHPGWPCPTKRAVTLYRRTGELGKLPISAMLLDREHETFGFYLRDLLAADLLPQTRAKLLIEHLSQVRRVHRKLATMWVSALSTPSLAPGLSPLHPLIDGETLTVVDTNVIRAIETLGRGRVRPTYAARDAWLRSQARSIELSRFHPAVAAYSPRILQQALYWFRSKSNRRAIGDPGVARSGRT